MRNPFENGLLSVDANGRIINRSGQPITIERQCHIPTLTDRAIDTPDVAAESPDVADLVNQLAYVVIPQINEELQAIRETLNQLIACSTKAGVLSAK